MATKTENIVVIDRGMGNLLVYCDPDIAIEIEKMPAVTYFTKLNGDCHFVNLSPRYNPSEVIAEIENLDAPIPAAFLDDTTG